MTAEIIAELRGDKFVPTGTGLSWFVPGQDRRERVQAQLMTEYRGQIAFNQPDRTGWTYCQNIEDLAELAMSRVRQERKFLLPSSDIAQAAVYFQSKDVPDRFWSRKWGELELGSAPTPTPKGTRRKKTTPPPSSPPPQAPHPRPAQSHRPPGGSLADP